MRGPRTLPRNLYDVHSYLCCHGSSTTGCESKHECVHLRPTKTPGAYERLQCIVQGCHCARRCGDHHPRGRAPGSPRGILSLRGSCTGATHLEKELNFVVIHSFLFTRLCTTLDFSLVYVSVCCRASIKFWRQEVKPAKRYGPDIAKRDTKVCTRERGSHPFHHQIYREKSAPVSTCFGAIQFHLHQQRGGLRCVRPESHDQTSGNAHDGGGPGSACRCLGSHSSPPSLLSRLMPAHPSLSTVMDSDISMRKPRLTQHEISFVMMDLVEDDHVRDLSSLHPRRC
jgi:hypothetical protein